MGKMSDDDGRTSSRRLSLCLPELILYSINQDGGHQFSEPCCRYHRGASAQLHAVYGNDVSRGKDVRDEDIHMQHRNCLGWRTKCVCAWTHTQTHRAFWPHFLPLMTWQNRFAENSIKSCLTTCYDLQVCAALSVGVCTSSRVPHRPATCHFPWSLSWFEFRSSFIAVWKSCLLQLHINIFCKCHKKT